MRNRWYLWPVLLFVAACQATPVPTGGVGSRLEPGSSRQLTLPPTQYERVHFLGSANRRYIVSVAGSNALPVSLSIYPVIAGPQGYAPASTSYTLKPFQRTSPLPVSAEVALPADWQASSAVVVEVKNLGSTVAEPTVRIEAR